VTSYFNGAVAWVDTRVPDECNDSDVYDAFAQMQSKCGSNRAYAYVFGVPTPLIPAYGIGNRGDEIVACPLPCWAI
jgi:hypothetical protein